EGPALAGGAGSGAGQQGDRGPRRGAEVHRSVRAGAADHVGDVVEDLVLDADLAGRALQLDDLLGRADLPDTDGVEVGGVEASHVVGEDRLLDRTARVVDGDLH